jgi:hypothetical protein
MKQDGEVVPVTDMQHPRARSNGTVLDVRYAQMCQAIMECLRVDEVTKIRNKVLALEVYARQAKNTDAERQACEIRLRAERRAGVLLRDLAEADMRASGPREGVPGPGRGKAPSSTTLSELGVTRDQSSKWQRLAQIPEPEFEAALSDPQTRPSTAALVREIRDDAAPIRGLPKDALWIWGRLRDFERDGFAAKSATDLYAAMTDSMQADVRRITPVMVAFLQVMSGDER